MYFIYLYKCQYPDLISVLRFKNYFKVFWRQNFFIINFIVKVANLETNEDFASRSFHKFSDNLFLKYYTNLLNICFVSYKMQSRILLIQLHKPVFFLRDKVCRYVEGVNLQMFFKKQRIKLLLFNFYQFFIICTDK